MSYLVLARKCRPQSFLEVTGQEHVTRTLANAITRKKIAHAYLLAGPRGVGKTSIARIFSKCLNCENGPTATPCGECTQCRSIVQGTSLAVREIDGASHNSVEDVRSLIENFRALPPPGTHYKVYIIDEVHMLSVSAFNALLKSLEEPPPNTVFILATTEAHKIPETVISRCQRHDLRSLTITQVEERLQVISTQENINVAPPVLRLIAKLSEGSLRDAQSLLDRVQSFCEGEITLQDAVKVLGTVDRSALFRISAAILNRNPQEALRQLETTFEYGVDPTLFIKDFVTHWREILLGKIGGDVELLRLGVFEQERAEILAQCAESALFDLQDLVYLVRQGGDEALRSAFPLYALESLVVRLALREPAQTIRALLQDSTPGSAPSAGGLRGGDTKGSGTTVVPASHEPKIIRQTTPGVPSKSVNPSLSGGVSKEASVLKREVSYQWESFVEFAQQDLGGFIVEQLKRLSVEQFSAGVLIARGPEFSLKYLTESDRSAKVKGCLAKFSHHVLWQITLTPLSEAGSAQAAPGSILHVERLKKEAARESKAQGVSSHPSLVALQKVFAGSTVEQIKTEED